MNILNFTTLYPNSAQPNHGVFVENRLRQLVESGRVSARVMAPVPWFPFQGRIFGKYGKYASVSRFETYHGLPVSHPRYLVIPKIGMSCAPELLAFAARRAISQEIANGHDFDLIDAHYFYPDGVAAVMLGERFGKPVVVTARGSDVNLLTRFPVPRRKIVWAAERAAHLITVSRALKDKLVGLGVPDSKIRVLRNGVNLELFRPIADTEFRSVVTGDGPLIASVGNLIGLKGHDLVIRALVELPEFHLVIVGQGPDYNRLRILSHEIGVAHRVHFLGLVPHDRMPEIYSMADVLVLASSHEGWANVLLEAMACGTPVAATNVSGTPEAVTTPEAGILIDERSPQGIARSLKSLFARLPSRAATRAHAELFSWDETTSGQIEIFSQVRGFAGRGSNAGARMMGSVGMVLENFGI